MGVVNTKFIYFCPPEDDYTLELIIEQLSISVRAEYEITNQLVRRQERDDSW
jgi:hypothetical protein